MIGYEQLKKDLKEKSIREVFRNIPEGSVNRARFLRMAFLVAASLESENDGIGDSKIYRLFDRLSRGFEFDFFTAKNDILSFSMETNDNYELSEETEKRLLAINPGFIDLGGDFDESLAIAIDELERNDFISLLKYTSMFKRMHVGYVQPILRQLYRHEIIKRSLLLNIVAAGIIVVDTKVVLFI